jgi:hypothetical protein
LHIAHQHFYLTVAERSSPITHFRVTRAWMGPERMIDLQVQRLEMSSIV